MNKTLRATLNIPIKIHWTAYVAVLATLVFALFGEQTWTAGFWSGAKHVAIITSLYALVIAHELGHCYEAIRRGILVDQITLWFLGGIAHIDLEKPFIKPTDEFWISVAGPVVNAAFILAAVPISFLLPEVVLPAVGAFIAINVVLLGFNLLPAFPMDGGRMLRSALSIYLERDRAQAYASYTALAFGTAFLTYGALSVKIGLAFIGALVIFINYKQIKGDGFVQ